MKTPRISYREWLHRKPTPSGSGAVEPVVPTPVPAQAARAPVDPPAAVVDPVTATVPVESVGRPPAPAIAPERGPTEHLVFRLGRELFAVPLEAVEEVLDIDRIQRLPEMHSTMLGVLKVRGRTVPVYAPALPLGVSGHVSRAALIFVRERGMVALAVDDVDDVLSTTEDQVQRSPLEFADGVLVGVTRRGRDLIGVLDADALIAACRAEPVLEPV